MNWNLYKVPDNAPMAIITHIASTKIPYRTAGKESIADNEEIEKEIKLAIQQCARKLRIYLSRVQRQKKQARRQSIYQKYVPYIAQFATRLSGKKKIPSVSFIEPDEKESEKKEQTKKKK
jgi:DNA topoisomerase-6 subunit B